MSDVEDDLFADSDSDDTADLIASSKATSTTKTTTPNNRLQKKKSPAAKKAAPAAKKASKPAAAAKKASKPKADSDSDDDDDDDDKGLFDSDSDDDDIAGKKPAAKKAAAAAPEPPTKTLSKREKMEALANRHRKVDPAAAADNADQPKRAKEDGTSKPGGNNDNGYGSEDSYDSETFERTKEDDDFLDTTGEDAEAVNELYADQHFNDERPDREDGGGKVKKRKIRYGRDGGDDDMEGDEAGEEGGAPMNPVMAAVHRMKKKKRVKLSFTEMEEEAKLFIGRMELAVEEDEMAIAERRPAVKKLAMLNEVLQMLMRRDIQRVLLDLDLLVICKRWVQPLKNGTLGNVTVRQRLMEAIANMTGDTGVNANDLKRSEFGKVVMSLAMHKSETPTMKRQLKALIDQWSRPIFQKSGNMRDLERVHGSRGEGGLAALSRQQHAVAKQTEAAKRKVSSSERQDLQSLITSGKKGGPEAGINRVRVPYSKGFNFSIRPENKTSHADSPADKRRAGPAKDNRGKLSKRMVEKGRAVVKSQASANVSVVGRPTK
jgi:transcription factor SPN1